MLPRHALAPISTRGRFSCPRSKWHTYTTKCLLARQCINASRHLVEMRGIEPRSDSNATGLLRVQFAKEFLSLSVSRKLGRLEQAQSTKSPLIPIDKELKQWLSK